MASRANILIVDDEKDIRFLLGEILGDEGYSVTEAPHSEAAFAAIAANGMPDLVILDIWLENSDRDGMEILADLKKKAKNLPVLMISGHGNIEMAVKAIKLGAYDFIEKPFNTDRLLNLVTRALESARLRRGGAGGQVTLIASSPEMQAVQKAALKAAQGDARILITGPWGSGRTHLAKWLHQESPRAAKPFATLKARETDAGALSEALARCNGGTLLLRDIGALPADAQAALLAAINAKIETRIIASAGPDLKDSGFNSDLYERLAVTHLALPPLAERRAEIPEIAALMLGDGCTLADDAATALKSRAWPGEAAELRAVIAMAQVRMHLDNARELKLTHLEGETATASETHGASEWLNADLRTARECFERWYFDHLTQRFNGNISQVATFAGMDRTALHRKLKALREGADPTQEAG